MFDVTGRCCVRRACEDGDLLRVEGTRAVGRRVRAQLPRRRLQMHGLEADYC